MIIASNIVIAIGLLFMVIGIIGMFKYKDFYHNILIAGKIDTVGLITVILGIALRHGVSFFSGKLLLIIAIIIGLNPLVAHVLARSAYSAGHKIKEDDASDINIEEESL